MSPTTPTATALIQLVQAEANTWDDVSRSKEVRGDAIKLNRAEARRDALDWVVAQLKRDLPLIETQAAEGERSAFLAREVVPAPT